MKPLVVLLCVFGLTLVLQKLVRGHYEFALAARVALSAMLVFTGIGHFVFTKGMSMMIPDFFPFKTTTVYLTGVAEIIFAIGLLIPNYRVVTAWAIIGFLVLVLPANIYASIRHVNYQDASFGGAGLNYLWFRIPLQILFIGWAYFSAIFKGVQALK